jgi:two-component system, OmpR family, response regulator
VRVLLIEDDAALASALTVFLREHGLVADVARSLEEARRLLPLAHWGAVLLDRHLPDGDGLTLMPTIRHQAPAASILVLTARDLISDRIAGLDAGADDYLVKPFDPQELLARLRAVERRRGRSAEVVIQLGQLSIDLARRCVEVKGQAVELTAKEWTLLKAMATRLDRIHSKESLLNELYGFSEETGSNTLEVFISNLRRKIGHQYIQTYRGLGYRLQAAS